MKLLKASFLLAAAATATQLDATDFKLSWSGASFGNAATATGVISLDLAILTSTPNIQSSSSMNSAVTGLTVTVLNAGPGSGTFVFSDFRGVLFYSNAAVDFNTDLVGQNGGLFVTHDDFNIFRASGSPSAPNGTSPNVLTPYGGSLQMKLVSFALGGLSDIPAWLSSINGQNRIYQTGVTLAELPLEGAHHRPMLSFDRMGKESQAWATGDFGSSSRTRDIHVTTGEAGVNWNVGKTGLIGFAAGHGEQNADLAFNGSSTTKGDYALVEYDYRPEGTQWIVSLLGMVGSWEAKTNRGYTSGGSTDFSFGVADIISRSARLRVDAPSLVTFGGFGFAPYASYSVTQTVVGGYTETGGAFPATFDEQTHNAQEARLGVTAAKDLSAATKLLLTVEAIHRFDGAGPSLTGQDVTGGVSFSLPGTAPRADCVRFGFDVDHKLNENTLLNISAHVATVGEAHDVSAAISIRRAF